MPAMPPLPTQAQLAEARAILADPASVIDRPDFDTLVLTAAYRVAAWQVASAPAAIHPQGKPVWIGSGKWQ